ncbi:MAG: ribonuclease P protein component [Deltaproteobacteria bacterium]|nr:ribonuclease P protein component [Deltaproteobacteria bacterium]
MMGTCSFRKGNRLLKREDFLRIGAAGRKIKTRHFIIIFSKNDKGLRRLGITASKKTGGAVQRNRVKRLVREFFRLNRKRLADNRDYIIIAGRGAWRLSFSDVKEELKSALGSRGLLSELSENRG